MGVSRAGYYKWLKHKPTIRDHRREEIVEKVKEVHEKHRTHGYRWTAAFIRINMHLEISDNYGLNGKSRLICNFLQVFEAQSKRSSPWAELRSLL